jgi:tetrapyrrole methylase family protein/MazG family protein
MIDIVGLGPGALERVPDGIRLLLLDPSRTVIVRTLRHPAARQLADLRPVLTCDDLYDRADTFDDVYEAIADRVLAERVAVYAVPGSPTVGELAVAKIRSRSSDVIVHPAESFLDVIFAKFGIDPLADGFQLLNAHDLPAVLTFEVPTVVGHLDRAEILADTLARVDRALPEGVEVSVVSGLGAADETTSTAPPADIDASLAGLRTSLFVPATSGGVAGVISTMHRLRRECPWDRKQTHESLVRYLLEETAELADAIAAMSADADDLGAYAEVEEELGDVLLQVLFHAAIAEQEGAFDITDVAESLRRKLVRRHPHVFGDVDAADAEAVKANWDEIKAAEKEGGSGASALAGVPASLGSLARAADLQARAAKVGFDWPDVPPVLAKVGEELAEMRQAVEADDRSDISHELGDLLFSVVNLARHVGVEPEVALRAANHRFESRFVAMEAEGPLAALTLDELDTRWERAKMRSPGRVPPSSGK